MRGKPSVGKTVILKSELEEKQPIKMIIEKIEKGNVCTVWHDKDGDLKRSCFPADILETYRNK